jgi:hypothetical protein
LERPEDDEEAEGGASGGAGPGSGNRPCWFDGTAIDDTWVADIVEAEGEEPLFWACHRVRRFGNVLVIVSSEKGYASGGVGHVARLRVLLPTAAVELPGWVRPGTFAGYVVEGELIVRRTVAHYWDPTETDGVTALFEVEAWRYGAGTVGVASTEFLGTLSFGTGMKLEFDNDPCAPSGEATASFFWSVVTADAVAILPSTYYPDNYRAYYKVPAGMTGCEVVSGIFGDMVQQVHYMVAVLMRMSGSSRSFGIGHVPIAYLLQILGVGVRAALEQWFVDVCTCEGVGAVPPGNLADQAADAGMYG